MLVICMKHPVSVALYRFTIVNLHLQQACSNKRHRCCARVAFACRLQVGLSYSMGVDQLFMQFQYAQFIYVKNTDV